MNITGQEKRQQNTSAINVPARIILNAVGVSFFEKHSRPLHQFNDSDGRSRFGFITKSINLAWLKKMMLKGFVEKIEFEIQEIAKTSDVLSDVVRLIFFSMFRHRIVYSVLDHVYNSPILKAWNRANPKRSIGPGVHLSMETIRNTLKPLETTVVLIQLMLRKYIQTRLHLVKNKWDDNNKLNFFIDEIVRDLDPFILFILLGSKEEDRMALIKDIGSQIIAFINMVEALDMASLLSIELASAAERSALKRVMTQQNLSLMIKEIPNLKHLFRHLMKEHKFRGTAIVISIPRYISKSADRLKFRFSFYNDAANANTERRLMEDFGERNRRIGPEKNLNEFFPREGLYGDNTMRFYYLSMLRQLCKKHNIMMNSSIRAINNLDPELQDSNAEASVTTLFFGL